MSVADEAVADPVGLIVRLIRDVDQHLEAERVHEVVCAAVPKRSVRRRLAQALGEDPSVLRTGRPPAPYCLARLLLALRAAGAAQLPRPHCGECGREGDRMGTRRGGRWACTSCLEHTLACAGCGELRRVASRDRDRQPRCARCPDTAGDPLLRLVELVIALHPGLDTDVVSAALNRSASRSADKRRLAWAVIARPDLLTGAGYDAPTPKVLRFIDELIAVGASTIVAPACPRCDRVKPLRKLLDGRRVCGNCTARHGAVLCVRCATVAPVATRDTSGRPLCHNCVLRDPINLENCRGCGRRRAVAVRQPDGPRCNKCRPRTATVCGICGQTAACELSRATGQPWCSQCQGRWLRCSGCGAIGPLRGGTARAPLCARCVNPDPDFWGRCPTCDTTWQHSPYPCQRCTLDQKVHELLADNNGAVKGELVPFRQALLAVERPDSALRWLGRPNVRDLLKRVGRDARPLSHELLDELPAGRTLAHLRSVLVATGALPARDEQLIALERWITKTVHARDTPAERQVLHSYATWHHLRRLRRRLGRGHANRAQALNVRHHVNAAVGFLDWLEDHDQTLATCTQADLDIWSVSEQRRYRGATAHFVRWAAAHRHASGLSLGAVQWAGPAGPHDTEKRWNDAHRLLRDDTLNTADRVAGLLVLLYAQRIATISQLTVDDVHDDGNTLTIAFGRVPITIPEPLATLVRKLIATRSGSTIIATAEAKPWLFPGRRPGQPLSDARLGRRLHQLGLHAERDRSTALFALATELPAAILARMLGIHITAAVAWQHAASGDWTAYAADVSRRNKHPTEGQPHPNQQDLAEPRPTRHSQSSNI